MKYSYRRAFLWVFIYVFLALLPLGIALFGTLPLYRNFGIELGVSFGLIALALFALQSLFSGRNAWVAPTYGMDNLVNFHRETGILAVLFFLSHPLVLFYSNPDFLYYLDPRVNLLRSLALATAIVSVILIATTSLWREHVKLSYEHWRLLHGLLAFTIVFIGIVHAIQVSHYLAPLWKKIVLAILAMAAMYLVIYSRIIRPWKMSSKPYRITKVTTAEDDCNTLEMESVTGKPMSFVPGQFAWLTIGDTPFSLQQHPFSFTSAAEDEVIAFTAKESGDFTSRLKDIEPGTTAFLEGPYGSFTLEPDVNLFLIMGGIGITPAMSMLRTLRKNKDPRESVLLYCISSMENVTFKEEIDEIASEINLKLVYVPETPPENWEGETGHIQQETLEKYLPSNPEKYMYFICGPAPMMDVAEIALRDLGIDWRLIYTERFNIV